MPTPSVMSYEEFESRLRRYRADFKKKMKRDFESVDELESYVASQKFLREKRVFVRSLRGLI